jgi:hypothetical protein
MTIQPRHQSRWYVRKGEQIQGPFPNQLISRYLILGRMNLDTEVSQDQIHWVPVKEYQALVPDVVLNSHTPEGHKALMIARIREDERSARSAEVVQHEKEERRVDEDQVIKLHRQLREDVLKRYRSRPEMTRRNVGLVLTVATLLFASLLLYRPQDVGGVVDCNAMAKPGVDWSACNKQGMSLSGMDLTGALLKSAQLSGADFTRSRLDGGNLSYADLSRAQLQQASFRQAALVGANLRMANLQGAVLRNADLSYAELEGARLDGAVLDGARFDNAIWINGKQCLAGSKGMCLLPK